MCIQQLLTNNAKKTFSTAFDNPNVGNHISNL